MPARRKWKGKKAKEKKKTKKKKKKGKKRRTWQRGEGTAPALGPPGGARAGGRGGEKRKKRKKKKKRKKRKGKGKEREKKKKKRREEKRSPKREKTDGQEERDGARRGGKRTAFCRLPPRRAASRRRVHRETSAKAGLPSADRSDKATLPLTGPVRASESSAKDPIPPVADTCDPRRRPARHVSAARGAPPPGWVLGRRAIAGPGRARLGRAGGAAAPRHGFRLRGVQPLPGGW